MKNIIAGVYYGTFNPLYQPEKKECRTSRAAKGNGKKETG
jgi:hypothetical protein